ncbi:MAG: hypothetical protein HYZ09_03740 [Candidatus Kerfeldbacteria bacterium]|nr:hypothetical protein [Candidatus Kerfeldbacteria bacterium]
MILVGVVAVVGLAVVTLLQLQQREGRRLGQGEQVYHVAEAGIHYYRWHLAHNPDDFTDGTGGPGPYVHEYRNRDGEVVGEFSLTITPPPPGSTIVTVRSSGRLNGDPVGNRAVVARLGIPSLTRYAVAANDVMRFGSGTETFGEIHSNNGIRYDGIAHGLVTSACSTYDDPDHTGPNEGCVHTHQPDPNAVFLGGRQYPVPPIDFNGLTADLSVLRDEAIANGIYLTDSSAEGYHLTLKTDGRLDMRRVTAMANCSTRRNIFLPWYPSYSVGTESSFTYLGGSSLNVPIPSNGVIFVEDDVWVDGQVNGSRVTIVAARDPLTTGDAQMIVNNDLTYTNYDGTDAIGLIAQNNFSTGLFSEDDLQIDAAIIAQRGRAGRYYYGVPTAFGPYYSPSGCGTGYYNRAVFTNNGAITTNRRYGWAYTDGTGYAIRNLNWDADLQFAPPPFFPTTGSFDVLNWDEED